MFKNRVLPVIVGLAAGWFVIFALEAVNHFIYPPPANLDYMDKPALTDFMESLPALAFVMLFVSWMIGAFAGGVAGALVKKGGWRNTAIIIGVILALGSIANMAMIPHPTWLMVLASIGYVPSAYLGGLITKHKAVQEIKE